MTLTIGMKLMRIKIYYNKNLKMSDGKLAAQCCHVARELGRMQGSTGDHETVVVLGLSATKFDEMIKILHEGTDKHYIQVDSGRTEVPENTITACGYIVMDEE